MSDPLVIISTVADGSMYNRHDPLDSKVINNRRTFLSKLGIELVHVTRVKTVYDGDNYCRYHEVTLAEAGDGMQDNEVIVADGLVTRDTGHALMLPVADCIGAVFYDPNQHILMLSHLSRHSLEQQGGIRSVEYLVQHYTVNPADLKVWLTPAPGKDVYPIWALDNKGMKEVTFEQLLSTGITFENIIDNPADSTKDLNYYSYSEFIKGNRTEDGDHMVVAVMTN
ncbi:MAG: laccase domain-containing protein [Candidatus Microsaccharimonas sp.]